MEVRMEHPKRSVIKACTWRITGYLVTLFIVAGVSGKVGQSFVAVTAADAIKIFLYYMHERAWNRVNFGRLKTEDYEI